MATRAEDRPRDGAWGSITLLYREGVDLGPAGCGNGTRGELESSPDEVVCLCDIVVDGRTKC